VLVAPNGEPYLAYQDFSQPSHRTAVRRFTGGAWAPPTLVGAASVGEGWYNRLVFQPDGTLVVATRDYGLAGRLGVRTCSDPGAGWTTLGSGSPSDGEAHYTDVTALPDGRIAVAFQDRDTTPPDRANVVVWDGATWTSIGGQGISAQICAYPSVDAGPDGVLHVAYTDTAHGTRACVQRYDAVADHWNPVGAPGFTPDLPNNLVLRVGPDGVPHVAYYVWESRIVVRRFQGGAWVVLGGDVDGADTPTVQTEGWRQWLGFEIDAQGRPVVAYQASNLGRRAVVKRFEPATGTWTTLGEPGFTPGAADYLSLALGPDGTPYTAFRDGTTGRAFVMSLR
jgi:hypothetical protein